MLESKPMHMKLMMVGVVIFVTLAIVISNVMISFRPIYVQNNSGIDGKPVNNITVGAIGKVIVKPDIVTFTAGYTVKKENISMVQKELNERNNAIVKALKEMGIEDRDITTADYDIQPNYRYDSGSSRILDGVNGTVRVNVKVRNLDKTGATIDSVLNAGGNIVENISFTIDDLEGARKEARILAAKAAKDKAQVLADASGAGLGGLISISEEVSGGSNPYIYNVAKSLSASDSSASAPTISAGSLEIIITIQATYGIK